MQVVQKVPTVAAIVMAAGLVALLVWSLWPQPALVLKPDDVNRPFTHTDPPSYNHRMSVGHR